MNALRNRTRMLVVAVLVALGAIVLGEPSWAPIELLDTGLI